VVVAVVVALLVFHPSAPTSCRIASGKIGYAKNIGLKPVSEVAAENIK